MERQEEERKIHQGEITEIFSNLAEKVAKIEVFKHGSKNRSF